MTSGVDDAGLMGFGAADHHAVGTAFHHVEEEIRIGLLMRGLGTVALGVGHGAVHGQVVLLAIEHKLFEVFMVVSAILFICFIGSGEYSVKRVHTYASLEA